MQRIHLFSFMATALLVLTSCKSGKTLVKPSELAGEWNIVTVGGQEPQVSKAAYIGLDGTRLYGCAGCNRIMGKFMATDDKAGELTFTSVSSTRMLCSQMEGEQAVLQALNQVAGYTGTAQQLVLTDKKGKELMQLEKRPGIDREALAGKWTIREVYGRGVAEIEEKPGKTPYLEFDMKQLSVHGSGGCNIVNGTFECPAGKPGVIRFGQMLSTMMSGPGLTLEREVFTAIDKVRSFVMTDNHTLVLYDENGEAALTLIR